MISGNIREASKWYQFLLALHFTFDNFKTTRSSEKHYNTWLLYLCQADKNSVCCQWLICEKKFITGSSYLFLRMIKKSNSNASLLLWKNISISLFSFEFSFAKRASPGFTWGYPASRVSFDRRVTWGSLAHFQLKLMKTEAMVLSSIKREWSWFN